MDQKGENMMNCGLKYRILRARMRIPGRRNRLRMPWIDQCRRLCGDLNIDPLRNLSQQLIGVGLFLLDRQ